MNPVAAAIGVSKLALNGTSSNAASASMETNINPARARRPD